MRGKRLRGGGAREPGGKRQRQVGGAAPHATAVPTRGTDGKRGREHDGEPTKRQRPTAATQVNSMPKSLIPSRSPYNRCITIICMWCKESIE